MTFFTEIKAKILKFLRKYKRCQIIQTIPNKVAGDVIVPYTTESKKEKQTQREWEGGTCTSNHRAIVIFFLQR